MAMPEGLSASRFPVLNFPNIVRLTANDKDFSLALEMTVGESHQSLLAPRQSSLPCSFLLPTFSCVGGKSPPLIISL